MSERKGQCTATERFDEENGMSVFEHNGRTCPEHPKGDADFVRTALCDACEDISLEGVGQYIGQQFLCEGCSEKRGDKIFGADKVTAFLANGAELVWTDKGRKFVGVRTIVLRIGNYELSLKKDAANMLQQLIHEAFKNDAQSTDSWTGKEV
jgi:hypothetical protein